MIWIRGDANKDIGMGHVMRCLTVAEVLRDRGEEVCFLLASEDAVPLLQKKGFSYLVLHSDYRQPEEELEQLEELLVAHTPALFLADGYFFTPAYYEVVGKHTKVACFEDMGQVDPKVDLLINYNIYADEALYPERHAKAYLCGAGYIPLREEFTRESAPDSMDIRETARKVLLTTGGADRYNLAGQILEYALEHPESSNLEYYVVSGAANHHLPVLQALENKYKNIHLCVAVEQMAELMKSCDVAITAGGSTMYELSAVGVPFVCFSFAENQQKLVDTYGENGWSAYAGNYLTREQTMIPEMIESIMTLVSDSGYRRRLSQNLRTLVDGKGAWRIAQALLNLCE